MISTLGEVCTFYSGTGFPVAYQGKNSGELPFYKVGDIANNVSAGNMKLSLCNNYVSVDDAREMKGIIIPADTIVFAKIGEALKLNRRAITSCDCLIDNNAMGIAPKPGTLRVGYFYFYMKSLRMQEYAESTTVPSVRKSKLEKVHINVPSIDEQVQIENVLDKVSSIIRNRQREINKLDELIKARFVELFEQGDYSRVEFGEICEFLRNGASIKQTKGAKGYPITRIETLSNDIFNADRLGYANIVDLEKYEKYILRPGDLLISHINSVAYLGRAVQYRGQMDIPIIHGMNLLCARIIEGYNPTYIEYFFKTPMAKTFISTITKKAVNQASITTSDLRKMPVPAPSFEEQNDFDIFVQQVDKSKVV